MAFNFNMQYNNYDEEQEEGPKSSFSTYLAEGDVLYKQGEYKKALDSYSLALELKPTDKFCLVARSKCYLQLGDNAAALRDAEAALEDDKDFNKGLYQKAEALYAMGDFEYALVYYHRGNKLRPELQEFRLGIQKAQEAIDNSIGDAANVKLENKGDLSFFAKQDEMKKPKGYNKPKTQATRTQQQQINRGKSNKSPAASDKTVKQLLGEMYADKEYLEKLLSDDDLVNNKNNNNQIHGLVTSGLSYLESRTEFWRQQKPLYARKKEKPKPKKVQQKSKPADTTKFILRSLEEIDLALAEGDAEGSLKQAQSTLRTVQSLGEDSVPNKEDVIGNLHSCIGNAYLEMDETKKALDHHLKDLKIADKLDNKVGKSRALDNLGRVHAKAGEYDRAIDKWMEKMPLIKTPLESTWLFHEIGRCHLELKNFQDAKEYGQKSLAAAQEADDQVWQLNATVLIAQAEVKLDELQDALGSFQQAHDLAKILEDEAAENAISKAIRDVNDRIAQGVKPSEGQDQADKDDEEKTEEKDDKTDKDKEEEPKENVAESTEGQQEKEKELEQKEDDANQETAADS
ncbi:tetratricopeptide repeat protein 25-like [Actinia tenebrosa]|uniref:Outer dynein arm-docking complex subunit 4 n=1 Tax=Actinia tenebrosa TaxID=6105 RepID=A0A6P8HWR0_ACTTE|nr:tetratricopeptide repeat protein 25-like [Actinia tenebrosa]